MHLAPLLSLALLAQAPPVVPKAPEVGYIYPPGGKAGTTINVRLAGFDWTPDLHFFFSDPRVKLELLGPPGPILVAPPPYWFGPKAYVTALPMPREIPARLILPADLPTGPIRWQVANANGGSAGAGVFWVGDGPEVLEDEKPREPQRLASLPVTLNGRLGKIEEVDRYRFRAPRTGPITCELFARRLGANLNGVLEVRDANDRVLADAADTEGTDLAVTFAVRKDEEYTIRLHDVDFRGDRSFVYRLQVTLGPRVVAALPATGRRGETRSVEFVGYGVATGQAKLESVTRRITFPGPDDRDSFLYRLETPHGTAPAFRLFVSDGDETVTAPAPADSPRPLAFPAAVSGCLERAGAEDHFRCKGTKGDVWSLAVEAQRLGSPLDVALTVLGPDGKELARADDLPGTTDAALEFTVPADGEYTLVVSDVAGKSGSRVAVYRLTAVRGERDFSLSVVPRVSVPIGGKADLQVKVQWQGPFREAIGLRVTGLPPGVSAPPVVVIPPDKTEVLIPLECAADAAAAAARVRVRGTAKHIGKHHVALATVPGNLAPHGLDDNQLDTLLVASTLKPVCRVTTVVADGTVKVNRGATYPAELTVERLEGFTGEISLQMAAQQSYQVQGICGPDFTVPPDAKRAFYPCFMPEWLETSRTSRMILIAVAKVRDPRGNVRHLVTDVAGRITMSIEGALLKVSAGTGELTIRSGREITLPVKIASSSRLTGPVKLELVLPEEIQGTLRMEPVVVPAGRSEAILRIRTSDQTRLSGEQSFMIRATAYQPGDLRVVSEATVPFRTAK
ncbi:MAG: PPC domain-containing protein [Planctomycetes bacterium]|nr:PPC domain-containing protein [Planctomycetota bacterium]